MRLSLIIPLLLQSVINVDTPSNSKVNALFSDKRHRCVPFSCASHTRITNDRLSLSLSIIAHRCSEITCLSRGLDASGRLAKALKVILFMYPAFIICIYYNISFKLRIECGIRVPSFRSRFGGPLKCTRQWGTAFSSICIQFINVAPHFPFLPVERSKVD